MFFSLFSIIWGLIIMIMFVQLATGWPCTHDMRTVRFVHGCHAWCRHSARLLRYGPSRSMTSSFHPLVPHPRKRGNLAPNKTVQIQYGGMFSQARSISIGSLNFPDRRYMVFRGSIWECTLMERVGGTTLYYMERLGGTTL
jgi:hypothetical protein